MIVIVDLLDRFLDINADHFGYIKTYKPASHKSCLALDSLGKFPLVMYFRNMVVIQQC